MINFPSRFASTPPFLLAAIFFLCGLCPLLAQPEVKIAIESQQVYQNEAFLFQVTVSAETEVESAPVFPSSADFHVEATAPRRNQSTSVTITNGKYNKTSVNETIYTFRLTAKRIGVLRIPSLVVKVDGKVHRTQAVPVQVMPAESLEDMALEVVLSTSECYVGQPVMVTWNWYIGRQVFDYRFQMPLLEEKQFVFPAYTPEIDPARRRNYRQIPLANDQQIIGRVDQVNRRGIQTDLLTFTVPMIPQAPGTFALPASTVTFTTPAKRSSNQRQSPFGGFFDRTPTRTLTVTSNLPALVVKELPTAGQPARFSGIIGACQIEVEASPRQLAVGDPIILTLRVSGPPFLDVVRLPSLSEFPELTSDFRVSNEEPGVVEQQHKSYQYTLRATHAKVTAIPSLSIPFFDPVRGEYAEAVSKPIPLSIEEVRTVTAHDAQGVLTDPNNNQVGELKTIAEGIAHNYTGERLLRNQSYGVISWSKTPWKLAFLVAWPGLYLLSLGTVTWKRRQAANPEAVAAQIAAKICLAKLNKLPARDDDCPAWMLTAINDFLAAKLKKPAAAAQSFREVQTPLQEAGVDNPTLKRLEDLLAKCEACRYAGNKATDTTELAAEAKAIIKAIDKAL